MKDLEKLLAVVQGLDPEKRVQGEDAPSDQDLVETRASLVEALRAAAEGDSPDVEAMRAIRSALDEIDAANVTRAEERKAVKAEAAELLKGIEVSTDGQDDGEGDAAEGDDSEGETEAAAEPEKVTVAASLSDAITRSARKAEKRKVEAVNERIGDVVIAATGTAQGHMLAQDSSIDDVAQLFNKFAPQVKRGSSVLVHMDKLYPEDRQLVASAVENTRKIDAVTAGALTALTAAGGVCDPLPADFAHPICGDRGRPITNALPAFGATRGGVRYAPSATVADLESAITIWDAATDADPGSATKACPRVECEEEESETVDAIVACLTVGNFQARFNPEFWRSRLDLLMVAHDRIAEQTAYAKILASSTLTAVPAANGDGTITDLLRVIDYQTAGLRSRHRLIGTQFVTILPSWVENAIRTQFANQAPAGSDDLFAVGDARMRQYFAVRGTTPVFSPDIELIASSQAAGAALAPYNTPFNVITFPQGTFLFLDGGTLDLGTSIADSTLNATNDRQAFMETFEQVAFRGCESLATPVAVAADCICA